MTGIVAHTYPEGWLKLTGQVAHWSTDYSFNKAPGWVHFFKSIDIGIQTPNSRLNSILSVSIFQMTLTNKVSNKVVTVVCRRLKTDDDAVLVE